jgi:hypothetical protein
MATRPWLPLHAQKAVVGRMLGLQIIVPNEVDLHKHGFGRALDLLKQHLYLVTDRSLALPDADIGLGVFLTEIVRELRAVCAQLPVPEKLAIDQVLDELSAVVTAYCASPYDPLKRLTDAAARTSSDYYRSYGGEAPTSLWDKATSQFTFMGGEHGLSFAPHIHLRARTVFDARDPLASQVIYEVAPKRLDAMTIACLPRIAFHEYIAHVPQGPYARARSHPGPSDAFAEGWMDYIAHRIYRSVLEQKGPCEALFTCLVPTWQSIYEEASENFLAARTALRLGDAASAARNEGSEAARLLHRLFQGLRETSADPDTPLYRLSFALNCSSLSNVQRRYIAAEFRADLLSAARAGKSKIVPVVKSWATGEISVGDLYRFILD